MALQDTFTIVIPQAERRKRILAYDRDVVAYVENATEEEMAVLQSALLSYRPGQPMNLLGLDHRRVRFLSGTTNRTYEDPTKFETITER